MISSPLLLSHLFTFVPLAQPKVATCSAGISYRHRCDSKREESMEVNILSELQATNLLLQKQNDYLEELRELLHKQNLFQKEVMDLDEACDYLNVSASYLYKQTHTNSITHYVPTGKKIFFKRSELDEFILRNRQSTNDEIEKKAIEYITYNKGGRRA